MSINRDMESIWTLLERAKTVYLACTPDGLPSPTWLWQSEVGKAALKRLKHRWQCQKQPLLVSLAVLTRRAVRGSCA